jgi:hypothetical protein
LACDTWCFHPFSRHVSWCISMILKTQGRSNNRSHQLPGIPSPWTVAQSPRGATPRRSRSHIAMAGGHSVALDQSLATAMSFRHVVRSSHTIGFFTMGYCIYIYTYNIIYVHTYIYVYTYIYIYIHI